VICLLKLRMRTLGDILGSDPGLLGD